MKHAPEIDHSLFEIQPDGCELCGERNQRVRPQPQTRGQNNPKRAALTVVGSSYLFSDAFLPIKFDECTESKPTHNDPNPTS